MKSHILFLLPIFILFSFFSCQKVIELDLNDENEKIIIEGIVNKDSTEHYVLVRKTINFDDNSTLPTIDDAVVTISDNFGNSQILTLISPGKYKTTNFIGVEGRTYTLNVSYDGINYISNSTMPNNVEIDSIMLQEFSFGVEPVYFPIPVRLDPFGVKNYYNFNLYKNNKRIDGIYLQDDEYSDGVEIMQPVFGGEYLSKDSLKLEMFCVDQFVYKYFYTLSVNAGGTGGATPANPESNISGGCLGYFSAQTKQVKSIIIP